MSFLSAEASSFSPLGQAPAGQSPVIANNIAPVTSTGLASAAVSTLFSQVLPIGAYLVIANISVAASAANALTGATLSLATGTGTGYVASSALYVATTNPTDWKGNVSAAIVSDGVKAVIVEVQGFVSSGTWGVLGSSLEASNIQIVQIR